MGNHLLIDAALGKPVPRTPVWIMRQAGRYMPEYMAIRAKMSFLELCHTPEMAAKVSLLPLSMLDIDGVIVFSDILVPLQGMGMDLRFDKGHGPVLGDPIRSRADIARLKPMDPWKETGYLPKTIQTLVKELDGKRPVLGFAGAPYTLACYAVEGGTARHYGKTKRFMLEDPNGFKQLLQVLADVVADLLNAQIDAGASLVQLFDTWAGDLMPQDFEEFALPYARSIIERVKRPGVPVVYFMNGVGGKLELMRQAGADMLGIDWRTDLAEVRRILGPDAVLQGNLDPCVLYSNPTVIERRVQDVLDANGGGPHVFNLGHGILPDIPVAHAKALVDAVKRLSVREPADG